MLNALSTLGDSEVFIFYKIIAKSYIKGETMLKKLTLWFKSLIQKKSKNVQVIDFTGLKL